MWTINLCGTRSWNLHWTVSCLFKYRELGTSLRESKLIPSHWYYDKLLFEQYSSRNTSFYEHLDARKQCFSAEKRTKIADFHPVGKS